MQRQTRRSLPSEGHQNERHGQFPFDMKSSQDRLQILIHGADVAHRCGEQESVPAANRVGCHHVETVVHVLILPSVSIQERHGIGARWHEERRQGGLNDHESIVFEEVRGERNAHARALHGEREEIHEK